MGIYTSDKIYGVKIFNTKDKEELYDNDKIYGKKLDREFDESDRNEVRDFYNNLDDESKSHLSFHVYTEYTSTLEYVDYRANYNKSDMDWFPIHYSTFLQIFNI